MIKAPLINACRHLLVPIVRILQRSGVTWAEFADLSKEVFVDVAGRDYGLQGRPTNASRVAMITGLSRREVARIRKILTGAEPPKKSPLSSIAQVLSGWHLDPDFLDADGRPVPLPGDGDRQSFRALLDKYAGDTPHGALTKELLQLELVGKSADGVYEVRAREYVRSALDPDMLRQAAVALHDHGATLAHNVDGERQTPPRFEGMASNPRVALHHVEDFYGYLEERGQAFLEEIDAWLAKHQEKQTTPEQSNGVRLGAGVYLIHDEDKR
jgi:hypothetical protein